MNLRESVIRSLYRVRDLQKRRTCVSTKAELEAMLERSEKAFARSYEEGLAFVSSWRYQPKLDLPADPDSVAYRETQLALYREISGFGEGHYRKVAQDPVDVSQVLGSLYPYSTGSLAITGSHFAAIGYWFQTMNLARGAKLIEFGAGCGDLSLYLAKCGYDVTATDISSSYVDVVRQRAEHEGVNIKTQVADMADVRTTEKFDAALFCEAFHHSDDHLKLLQRLDEILAPDGRIFFLGEPVTLFPMPWGVRLDGESVWAARKHGWLELGFDTRYFRTMLERRGWNVKSYRNKAVGHRAYCIEATRNP